MNWCYQKCFQLDREQGTQSILHSICTIMHSAFTRLNLNIYACFPSFHAVLLSFPSRLCVSPFIMRPDFGKCGSDFLNNTAGIYNKYLYNGSVQGIISSARPALITLSKAAKSCVVPVLITTPGSMPALRSPHGFCQLQGCWSKLLMRVIRHGKQS